MPTEDLNSILAGIDARQRRNRLLLKTTISLSVIAIAALAINQLVRNRTFEQAAPPSLPTIVAAKNSIAQVQYLTWRVQLWRRTNAYTLTFSDGECAVRYAHRHRWGGRATYAAVEQEAAVLQRAKREGRIVAVMGVPDPALPCIYIENFIIDDNHYRDTE